MLDDASSIACASRLGLDALVGVILARPERSPL
jgi:hypothetical protein